MRKQLKRKKERELVIGMESRFTRVIPSSKGLQNLIKKRHLLPNHILSYIFASTKLQSHLKILFYPQISLINVFLIEYNTQARYITHTAEQICFFGIRYNKC